MNTIYDIQRAVASRNINVFLRADFRPFGSKSQVDRALAELLRKGILVKLGVGVYVKAKQSILTGKPIPIKPLEVLVPEVLERLGVQVEDSRQTHEYNSGQSTQVSTGVISGVGKNRITRNLSFNG